MSYDLGHKYVRFYRLFKLTRTKNTMRNIGVQLYLPVCFFSHRSVVGVRLFLQSNKCVSSVLFVQQSLWLLFKIPYFY